MIQETFLRPGLNPGIPNYTLYRNDRDNTTTYRTYGGTCIYVKNSLVHHQKPSLELQSIEHTLIELNLNNSPPITFASIYVKPQFHSTSCLKKLIEANKNTILAGDFNASHTSWNDTKNTVRGIKFHKFFNSRSDIKIIAPHTPTHFSPRARYGNTIMHFSVTFHIAAPLK
ncbi:RNA-directed DNA polymerase from mobile element jockey [Caerostris extrusa]|uniref:RNA-directed DNA polymerase from mobile element jockey n=1 Tax=Caerostris extrusa TaxID=172846 RepID=A0AAV4YD57_CAEEX|nr:RNA-directed DNA polymerase from mobile element jockey [Caerostris extrusa]